MCAAAIIGCFRENASSNEIALDGYAGSQEEPSGSQESLSAVNVNELIRVCKLFVFHVDCRFMLCSVILGGATGRALDLRSTGCEFKILNPAPGKCCVTTLGKLFTPMCLSPSSITWYWPRGGDALWLGR